MKTGEELRKLLYSIDRKGYPAYKGTKGAYRFGRYTLVIDHVQGDPFAAPSRVHVEVAGQTAGFPEQVLFVPGIPAVHSRQGTALDVVD